MNESNPPEKKNLAESEEAWGYFVGSERRVAGKPLPVHSCYDDKLVGVTFRPPEEAVEEALELGANSAREMAQLPTHARAGILRTMSEGVAAREEDFLRLLALEAGKPIKAGKVEVERCIFNLRHASEEAQRMENEFIPLDLLPSIGKRWAAVRRFPVGLILAITPFNFPLNLVGHKVAPAIAAGNATIQKPASKTPLCSLLLAQIAYESGLPAGGLSVLPMGGAESELLTSDDRFRLLTFTGSAEVGWALREKAKRKRVALELGGNAGVIVHDDANIEDAAAKCAAGGFSYAGQSCIAVQRIFVQERAYDRFLEMLVDRVGELKVGNPLDETTDVGPLISEEDARRVESWISEARDGGSQVLIGGNREDSLVEPTVLSGTDPAMKVNCEEIFGPVVTVEKYTTFQDALHAVNNSRYGLQAGVFTNRTRWVFDAFEQVEAGGVVINDVPTFRADHMPYGGVKDSGLGREGAKYAIEEMTERKVLVLNLE